MLTFKQLVSELARKDVTLSPTELSGMIARFGDKVRQMGHLEEDGSMLVPMACIVEAARSSGAQELSEPRLLTTKTWFPRSDQAKRSSKRLSRPENRSCGK